MPHIIPFVMLLLRWNSGHDNDHPCEHHAGTYNIGYPDRSAKDKGFRNVIKEGTSKSVRTAIATVETWTERKTPSVDRKQNTRRRKNSHVTSLIEPYAFASVPEEAYMAVREETFKCYYDYQQSTYLAKRPEGRKGRPQYVSL